MSRSIPKERSEMPISVVIPYYRAADTIEAQLAALAEQRCPEPWEVVIADNESSDELRRIIPRHEPSLPSLRVVDASARRGEGHARNVGVRGARGGLIAFCDADAVGGAERAGGGRGVLPARGAGRGGGGGGGAGAAPHPPPPPFFFFFSSFFFSIS